METKKFKQYQSRYSDIAKVVSKGKLLTLTEIRKELLALKPSVEMSLQGIKKNLRLMEINHQVIYLVFNKNTKKFSQKVFHRKFNKNFNKYYLATPKTWELFEVLHEKITKLNNKKKYLQMIEDVLDHYTNIEIGASIIKKSFADEKLIHSVIKEKKKGKKVLQKEIDFLRDNIGEYLTKNKKFKEVKLKLPIKKIDVNGIKYFLVNDELIPVEKYIKFMKLLDFDIYMKWIAYSENPPEADNRKHAVIPAIKAMNDLFIEIVKDSQIKV